ncbi:hypothetical protein [Actinoplanes sp. NPDC051851]|uniref:hypothetical protein n=1 Tax=Actinoplanes sp. NPDC051851 TaxID=3154753 RepID=UPI0034274293
MTLPDVDDTLRIEERLYFLRKQVDLYRESLYARHDPPDDLIVRLERAETELDRLERRSSEVDPLDLRIGADRWRIYTTSKAAADAVDAKRRTGGAPPAALIAHETGDPPVETGIDPPVDTGIEVVIDRRMAQVPTSIYHLFRAPEHALITCDLTNRSGRHRRLRVTVVLERYSAPAVETVELPPDGSHTVEALPTLFPDLVQRITELTVATVSILIEDLEGPVVLHRTGPIPLLARSTAPLAVLDPATARWTDLSPYLGAFVTPNEPSVMAFLRTVVDQQPNRRLVGYQMTAVEVEEQVKAVFAALKLRGVAYVDSVVAFNPDEGTGAQRVRLPREALADRMANCIDGTVLFASLLEGMTINPALVIVPKHAFVAWETGFKNGNWRYLETTRIGTSTFTEACQNAETSAAFYEPLAARLNDPARFRRWPLSLLRSAHGITPME